jgi:micrococcal nuclease
LTKRGLLAHLVERRICNAEVTGSIPVQSTVYISIFSLMFLKNKTIIILLIGFVFLFSAMYFLRGEVDPKISASPTFIETATAKMAAKGSVKKPAISEKKSVAAPAKTASIYVPGVTASSSEAAVNGPYYIVTKVVDGDTIDISYKGKVERLRLIGINTPEVVDPRKTVECFGREASENAKKLLTGQEVRVAADPSQDARDKYGRLLMYVWRRDGLFYNLEAIKDGFAYEYTYNLPYMYQKDFRAAQKYAQENKAGLWADGVCGQKNIAVPMEKTASSSSAACLIKGNIGTTGDKIYHLPKCPYYKQTVISESQGEKWFCTEAEAIAAGWRKAKNCP